jgi:DNA (cytosine-5)-methyltransferase 1
MSGEPENDPPPPDEIAPVVLTAMTAVGSVLLKAYREAEQIVSGERVNDLTDRLTRESYEKLRELGAMRNAARGAALTLCAYKVAVPAQDIRAHKSEHAGGFSARSVDTNVTIPFLIDKSLPRNVESHWLSQTFSFAGPYARGSVLRTQPRAAGPLLIDTLNLVEEAGSKDYAYAAVVAIIQQLIAIRDQPRVILTRPKDLSVERTVELVARHLARPYRQNAPRLPQLVIHAAYQRIVETVGRYKGIKLEPLERMKSADRKAGTVGDIVVTDNGAAVEAVEIKFAQEVAFIHVAEAIEKVRAQAVRRYYILSTLGISPTGEAAIDKRRKDFLVQNGYEIIIDGVLETLAYYLRLLPSTTVFLLAYAELLETDPDTNYEHRIAWNECCQGDSE